MSRALLVTLISIVAIVALTLIPWAAGEILTALFFPPGVSHVITWLLGAVAILCGSVVVATVDEWVGHE